MASNKQYASVQGIVQQFPEKDVVSEREVSGQTISEFTIRSISTQKLVRVTLWPELADAADKVVKGALVAVDGAADSYQGKDGKTYNNISASEVVIVQPEPKAGREVVNRRSNEDAADEGPGF